MPQHLRELSPRHHAAIRMRLDGRSSDEIAKQLGVKLRTVYIWFSDPLVRKEMRDRLNDFNEEFYERLAKAATASLDALLEIAEGEADGAGIEQRHRAAAELLDRFRMEMRLDGPRSLAEEMMRLLSGLAPDEQRELVKAAQKDAEVRAQAPRTGLPPPSGSANGHSSH